jgi:hypothetical protein
VRYINGLSQEMQLFLRNNTGDSEKVLTPLLKESQDKLYFRYKDIFGDFNKEVSSEAILKINEFQSYVKDSKVFLEKLTEQT